MSGSLDRFRQRTVIVMFEKRVWEFKSIISSHSFSQIYFFVFDYLFLFTSLKFKINKINQSLFVWDKRFCHCDEDDDDHHHEDDDKRISEIRYY